MNTDDNNQEYTQDDEVTIEPEVEEQTLSGISKKQKEKVATLESERAEYLDGWQRARAEMVNLKKTHAEEKILFGTLGKQSLLEDLIPILDNFDSAFANKEAWEQTPKTWRIGIEYIHKQFLEVLEQNGVQKFGAVGESFDAQLHEPVEMVAADDEKQKNTIMSVVQVGYKLGDRIVRPAKVTIGE